MPGITLETWENISHDNQTEGRESKLGLPEYVSIQSRRCINIVEFFALGLLDFSQEKFNLLLFDMLI